MAATDHENWVGRVRFVRAGESICGPLRRVPSWNASSRPLALRTTENPRTEEAFIYAARCRLMLKRLVE